MLTANCLASCYVHGLWTPRCSWDNTEPFLATLCKTVMITLHPLLCHDNTYSQILPIVLNYVQYSHLRQSCQVICWLLFVMINMCTKFEVSSFTRAKDAKGDPNAPKWVTFWVTLGVRGHSRSSVMSSFDRLHMISY